MLNYVLGWKPAHFHTHDTLLPHPTSLTTLISQRTPSQNKRSPHLNTTLNDHTRLSWLRQSHDMAVREVVRRARRVPICPVRDMCLVGRGWREEESGTGENGGWPLNQGWVLMMMTGFRKVLRDSIHGVSK